MAELRARDLRVEPIARADADRVVKRYHYSGRVVPNSQLHLGVFLAGRCGGALQFGPSMVKRNSLTLVTGTAWNGFLELNRAAFADWMPRNSESRAISVALRLIRKNYPHVEWVLSYADATQCGDGAIYRAAGFLLTDVRRNKGQWLLPDGTVMAALVLRAHRQGHAVQDLGRRLGVDLSGPGTSMEPFRRAGARPLPGFMLRYIFFLNPAARERLAVPVLPYSEVARLGATMYRGRAGASQEDRGPTPAGRCDTDPPASEVPA